MDTGRDSGGEEDGDSPFKGNEKEEKNKKILNDDATILSVNAFRALGRIILHRSTRGHYILRIILRISFVFPQSVVLSASCTRGLYLFVGFYAYRISCITDGPYPFRWN